MAITGASGAIYGIRLLEVLRSAGVKTHLVISKAGALALGYETDMTVSEVKALADETHPIGDVGASIASGSFQTQGMVVAPCSVKTLSEIASGVTSNLISRAADVALKERRRVVLMLRETPPAPRPHPRHGAGHGNGRHHISAGAGLLHPAQEHRRAGG